jgi:hypothetical protein
MDRATLANVREIGQRDHVQHAPNVVYNVKAIARMGSSTGQVVRVVAGGLMTNALVCSPIIWMPNVRLVHE